LRLFALVTVNGERMVAMAPLRADFSATFQGNCSNIKPGD
jgi:hypothetical protein